MERKAQHAVVIVLYLALLAAGVSLFALSFVAQYRLATLLRQRYPQHWQIIAAADQARPSAWRRWARMQQVLRSPALPAQAFRQLRSACALISGAALPRKGCWRRRTPPNRC